MAVKAFSYSSMATWRTCKYKYYLQYVLDYSSPPGMGQARGTVGHAALAEWYTNGMDNEKALKKAEGELTNIEIANDWDMAKDWEHLSLVLKRYFDWARGNDRFDKVLSTELKYEVEIEGHKLIGFIDGVIESKKQVWILEHKFLKQASTQNVTLDMQISTYMIAATLLGYHPHGVMYNVIRMTETGIASTQPVLRTYAYRNSEGLSLITQELVLQMEEMDKFHTEGGVVYRNPTKDCNWACSFKDVCLSLNDSGEAESVLSRMPKISRDEKKLVDEGVNEL